MVFLLLLLAVTAMSLNVKSGMQARMAANKTADMQVYFDQLAVMEDAVWELTQNPFWRTATDGEKRTYPLPNDETFNLNDSKSVETENICKSSNGKCTTFTLKVENSSVTDYTDAVIVSVSAPSAVSALRTSLRYYLSDFLYLNRPDRVCHDSADNLFIADAGGHSIFKVDRFTHALIRVAGNGTSGSTGDGGSAVNAQLKGPQGVWVNSLGEIYIADSGNHRIRKVDTGGNIATVAGTGTLGYSGDTGPATSAQLNSPAGITIDSSGNIFIADTGNHAVRKINAVTGNIERVAGIEPVAGVGSPGFSGNGGPALSATLNNPYGVYVNAAGNIYIADTNNCWIRKVDATTKIISLVAGNTSAGSPVCSYSEDGGAAISASLNYPRDVYVHESTGEITIADTSNHRIRRFLEGGNIATIAGTGVAGYSGEGGLATSAAIDTPRGVTVKSTGELVIADSLNSCLRQVTPVSKIISTITGTGNPTFGEPRHIAVDASGNVYIADMNNHRVRKMDPAGRVETVAGTGVAGYSGDGGLATNAQLNSPAGIAIDGSGNIIIADTGNCWIRKVDASTKNISRVAGKTTAGLPDCGQSGDGGPATSARLNYPADIAVHGSGNIIIADTNNCLIRKVDDSTKNISKVAGMIIFGIPLCFYSGDGGSATAALLNKPYGVDVKGDNIYIADTTNNRIRKVDAAGTITTVAGDGTAGTAVNYGDNVLATSAKLNKPVDVFVDSAGNLYIADTDLHVVRVVSAQDDKIYTLAGKAGTAGYNWQGIPLPAVTAQLNSPASVAMAETRGGRLIYISDWKNKRIRMLTLKMEKKLY